MFFGNVPFVNSMCARSWACGKHVPGLPDLILFWANDMSVVRRDENGRKRSAKDSTTFTFTFFYRKRKRYGIFGNENGAGISVISKMKIYGREHIDNGRNPSKWYLKNDKYIKQ